MITIHQYLHKHPVDSEAERLMLGTIHPHEHDKFLLPYFYGNELSFWKIFNKALPAELTDPADLNQILGFLKKRRITVSGTILSCKRKTTTALDKDLEPIKLHKEELLLSIKKSNIKEISCTSGYEKNNAFKLFYADILDFPITNSIPERREVDLPMSIFGRPVNVKVLYSPARTANRGIARSRLLKIVQHQYLNYKHQVETFEIDLHKKAFN